MLFDEAVFYIDNILLYSLHNNLRMIDSVHRRYVDCCGICLLSVPFWSIIDNGNLYLNHQHDKEEYYMNRTQKRILSVLTAAMTLSALPQLTLPAHAAKTKLLGDVNSDSVVSIADSVLLARYVAKWDGITLDKDTADIDRSSKIDTKDAMILSRYLAKWNGYEKYIYSIDTDPFRIETQPKPFAIDYGESAKLTVKAAGGEAPYTYQWSRNGVDIEGAVGDVYVPVNGGNYRCVMTDSDGTVIVSQTAQCAIHPIIKRQPIDGADSFHVEIDGGTDVRYHWEKEVLDEWVVQRDSQQSSYGATVIGKYRCVITDSDGYQVISEPVRWYGSGELEVSNIYLSNAADANYGLTIDFTHHKIEKMRYPVGYYTVGYYKSGIHSEFVRYTQEDYEAGVEIPRDVDRISYYDYNTPVCAPYAASALYGDYLDLYVDATGEGPLYFDWQIAPSFEQALAGSFTSIKKESGCLGLGTEHLRFAMKDNVDPVYCYGYIRCIVTDRNGISKTAEFGNPWGFDHEMFLTDTILSLGGNGPAGSSISNGKIGGLTNYAWYWYRDGAKELAIWGCKAPTFKELPEETVSGAELPLNPVAEIPSAPIKDTSYDDSKMGTRDAAGTCSYLKMNADGYFDPKFPEFTGGGESVYDYYPLNRSQDLELADNGIPVAGVGTRDYLSTTNALEIENTDGTYLPAVQMDLYLYNMHDPVCKEAHDKKNWFGPGGGVRYQSSTDDASAYMHGATHWWFEFSEPVYESWYLNNVRYLYAYADHPVTVKNPDSYQIVLDDIDLTQITDEDTDDIVDYLQTISQYKGKTAEQLAAMLPIELEQGDLSIYNYFMAEQHSDHYHKATIAQLVKKAGGNVYCALTYPDGTVKYTAGKPKSGYTVLLTGMGTYKDTGENTDGAISVLFGLDDFSLNDAKKALPYAIKTGMASDQALRSAKKLKTYGLEYAVIKDGAKYPPEEETPPEEGPSAPESPATYTVTLESCKELSTDAIKALQTVLGTVTGTQPGLKDTKALFENAPSVLLENATKEQAEQIKTAMEKVGTVVSYQENKESGS